MRILVVGAGAIGSFVGGSLASAGHTVVFAARPEAAQQLQAHGLRLTVARTGETRPVPGISAASSLADALASNSFDCLALAVKAYDTAGFVTELRTVTAEPPPILCLQNGVDSEAELARAFGPRRVIAGTITTPVSKRGAAEIVIERERGAGVALDHPLGARLVEALNTAGVRTRGYAAAGPMKWSKLFTNLVGNATAAILDMPVGAVFADPRLFALERAQLRECLGVMRAYRYPVVDLPGVPVRALAFAVGLPHAFGRLLLRRGVGAGRGGKMPSLHIDLHAGRRRTEVGWLHGAVARHAQSLGLLAPVNQALASTVQALAAGELPLDAFRGQPAKFLDRITSQA